ncbi:hypothetical protein DBR42_20250 [Pelomonas sp. HMWF004]|nr:hypothetical protein DBR42_20250 [Pelomonas sp. HMWF004]
MRGESMRLTKLLLYVCMFGLLSGARIVNESRIVLKAAQSAQQIVQTGVSDSQGKAGTMGDALLVFAFTIVTVADSGVINGVVRTAASEMIFGCILMAAAVLTLLLLAITHLKAGNPSALESARARRRERG